MWRAELDPLHAGVDQREFTEKRRQQGHSRKDTLRVLKRYSAREMFAIIRAALRSEQDLANAARPRGPTTLAGTTIGLYKTECIRPGSPFRKGPFHRLSDLEKATSTCIHWYNPMQQGVAGTEDPFERLLGGALIAQFGRRAKNGTERLPQVSVVIRTY